MGDAANPGPGGGEDAARGVLPGQAGDGEGVAGLHLGIAQELDPAHHAALGEPAGLAQGRRLGVRGGAQGAQTTVERRVSGGARRGLTARGDLGRALVWREIGDEPVGLVRALGAGGAFSVDLGAIEALVTVFSQGTDILARFQRVQKAAEGLVKDLGDFDPLAGLPVGGGA